MSHRYSLQFKHHSLAYSHENGVVLVDIIQKCVILSATLIDLYGCSAPLMTNNRDNISIQPFITSSILQHHYQSNAPGAAASLSAHSHSGFNSTGSQPRAGLHHNNSSSTENSEQDGHNDNSQVASLYKSATTLGSSEQASSSQVSWSILSLCSLTSRPQARQGCKLPFPIAPLRYAASFNTIPRYLQCIAIYLQNA